MLLQLLLLLLLLSVSSKITKKLIENIISIMVTYYLDEVKHMLDVNDPGVIKGLNTHEDLIVKFPLRSLNTCGLKITG